MHFVLEFLCMCESMEVHFKCLPFHTEVQWLTKGKFLTRFICLKKEIVSFLNSIVSDFHFNTSEIWWPRITF